MLPTVCEGRKWSVRTYFLRTWSIRVRGAKIPEVLSEKSSNREVRAVPKEQRFPAAIQKAQQLNRSLHQSSESSAATAGGLTGLRVRVTPQWFSFLQRSQEISEVIPCVCSKRTNFHRARDGAAGTVARELYSDWIEYREKYPLKLWTFQRERKLETVTGCVDSGSPVADRRFKHFRIEAIKAIN